jgi:hypothetical protein
MNSACSSPAAALFESNLHGMSTDHLNMFSYPKFGTSTLTEMLFSVPVVEENSYQISPPASPAHLMEFNVDDSTPLPFTAGFPMINTDNDLDDMLSFVDSMSSTDSDGGSPVPKKAAAKRVKRTAEPKVSNKQMLAAAMAAPYTVPVKPLLPMVAPTAAAAAAAAPLIEFPAAVVPVMTYSTASSENGDGEEYSNKRDSHNVSERMRRQDLKKSFNTLRSYVPAIAENSRVHTGSILRNTIEYVRHLQAEEQRIDSELAQLRAENARLKAAKAVASTVVAAQ